MLPRVRDLRIRRNPGAKESYFTLLGLTVVIMLIAYERLD